MEFYNQAPTLKAIGEKTKDIKWGRAIRTHHLESVIFNGIPGNCGAQLKLILFLTGNSADGNFSVAEKTVMERCGMTKETYIKARKALVDKGWLIHHKGSGNEKGEIIVDYNAIYNSEIKEEYCFGEDTSCFSEYTSTKDTEYTHNKIKKSLIKENKINNNFSKPERTEHMTIEEYGRLYF